MKLETFGNQREQWKGDEFDINQCCLSLHCTHSEQKAICNHTTFPNTHRCRNKEKIPNEHMNDLNNK